jgi:hypothetical protein
MIQACVNDRAAKRLKAMNVEGDVVVEQKN